MFKFTPGCPCKTKSEEIKRCGITTAVAVSEITAVSPMTVTDNNDWRIYAKRYQWRYVPIKPWINISKNGHFLSIDEEKRDKEKTFCRCLSEFDRDWDNGTPVVEYDSMTRPYRLVDCRDIPDNIDWSIPPSEQYGSSYRFEEEVARSQGVARTQGWAHRVGSVYDFLNALYTDDPDGYQTIEEVFNRYLENRALYSSLRIDGNNYAAMEELSDSVTEFSLWTPLIYDVRPEYYELALDTNAFHRLPCYTFALENDVCSLPPCQWATLTNRPWNSLCNCTLNECRCPHSIPSSDPVSVHLRYPARPDGNPDLSAGYWEVRSKYCNKKYCSQFKGKE